ncbi:MAG: N(4)-(beta-N-acetylglucosaminyl)-L-asparaginase [Myxococcales bacterium]|nr:N(4)-(beta-N-acetylglucosaminyl)-L-asparaginase [Myxococcales bacterium]
MLTRRELLATSAAALAAPTLAQRAPKLPLAVASGNGLRCVQKAIERMQAGADPLDAAIDGVAILEDDPTDMTVGLGGVPNEEGVVQLDASVMHGPSGRAGAVASLEGIRNPSRVAKLVMETTDHVLLVGPGALRFARMHGFTPQELLTEKARKVWLYWKQNLSARDKWLEPEPSQLDPDVRDFIREYGADPFRDPRSYGTVHLSAAGRNGELAGCTSTSGLFFKMPGRVGDSPIIGAGLYTDNGVGSAGATGRGEACILFCAAHTAVELMRQGKHPKDACLEVLRRIASGTRDGRLLDRKGRPSFGVTIYAIDRRGEYGSASLWAVSGWGKPRQFAVADSGSARLEDCAYLFEGNPEL